MAHPTICYAFNTQVIISFNLRVSFFKQKPQNNYQMMEKNVSVLPNLDTPATYRINVRGYMPSDWSNHLGGLTITTAVQKNGEMVTTLSGQVRDQAALIGVIRALYDRRLPLVSIECLECEVEDSGNGK